MLRRHAHPADHVHFASGFAGWARWIAYWALSRSANAARALIRFWRTRLRPSLAARRALLVGSARTALGGTRDTSATSPYSSLAEAVRRRGFTDAHG